MTVASTTQTASAMQATITQGPELAAAAMPEATARAHGRAREAVRHEAAEEQRHDHIARPGAGGAGMNGGRAGGARCRHEPHEAAIAVSQSSPGLAGGGPGAGFVRAPTSSTSVRVCLEGDCWISTITRTFRHDRRMRSLPQRVRGTRDPAAGR